MSNYYEKYRYDDKEQPENGYVAPSDHETSTYFTPTDHGYPGSSAEYDHGMCSFGLKLVPTY